MYKVNKILALCLTTIMALGATAVLSPTAYAYENNYISNSTTKKQLFAVPEGGWSTITAKVDYIEYYVPSGSNNKFTSRVSMAVYKTAAATSTPYVTVGNVKHSNDKAFKKWSDISIIFDSSKWDSGFGKENTDSVTYSATTNVTGKLAFLVSCDGAIPATSAGSVDLNLKTK